MVSYDKQRLLQDLATWLQFRGVPPEKRDSKTVGHLDTALRVGLTRLDVGMPVGSLQVKTSEMPHALGSAVKHFFQDSDLVGFYEAIKNQAPEHGFKTSDITRLLAAGWEIEIIRDDLAPPPFVPSEEHNKFARLLFNELSRVWEKARPEDIRAYSETYSHFFNKEDNKQRKYCVRAARSIVQAAQGRDPKFTIDIKDFSKDLMLATNEFKMNEDAAAHIQLLVLKLVLERWLEMDVKLDRATANKAAKNAWGFNIR